MVIIQKYKQLIKYSKYFFQDLLNAKVFKTLSNEGFLHV
jgi:hypothetical protein